MVAWNAPSLASAPGVLQAESLLSSLQEAEGSVSIRSRPGSEGLLKDIHRRSLG